MAVPPSERGVSGDGFDQSKRDFLVTARNMGVLAAAAEFAPWLLACRPSPTVGTETQGIVEQALAEPPKEFDPSGLNPRVLWTGEFVGKGDYLENVFAPTPSGVALVSQELTGEIIAHDLRTGKPMWDLPRGSRIVGSKEAVGIYVLYDGNLILVDEKTGQPVFSTPFPGINRASLVESDGFLGMSVNDGGINYFVALSKQTRAEIFRQIFNAERYFVYAQEFDKNRILVEQGKQSGAVEEVSSIDVPSGKIVWAQIFEGDWFLKNYGTRRVLIMENRKENGISVFNGNTGNPLWAKPKSEIIQIYRDSAVVRDLGNKVFRVVPDVQNGAVSAWEATSDNSFVTFGTPADFRSPVVKNWYWNRYQDTWVQAVDIKSGNPVWETREFGLDSSVLEFPGNRGVLVGKLKGQPASSLIGIDLATGKVKWNKDYKQQKGQSFFIGHDFGLITYSSGGLKYYFNPKDGEPVGALQIADDSNSGWPLEKTAVHYSFNKDYSRIRVIVTGV